MQDKHRFMVRALTHRYRRDRADDFLDEMRARIDALRAALADRTAVAARRRDTRRAGRRRRDGAIRRGVSRALHIARRRSRRQRGRCGRTGSRRREIDCPVSTLTRAGRPIRERRRRDSRALLSKRVEPSPPCAGPTRRDRTAPLPLAQRSAPVRSFRPRHARSPSSAAKAASERARSRARSPSRAADRITAARRCSSRPIPRRRSPTRSAQRDAPWADADVENELDEAPRSGRSSDGRDRGVRAPARSVSARGSTRCSTRSLSHGVDVDAGSRHPARPSRARAARHRRVFALSILGDTLAERRFARIVVDPAPTGHLLRLLEMPAIALDWSHRLHASDAQVSRRRSDWATRARELLDFAKRTRALDALLHDAERCGRRSSSRSTSRSCARRRRARPRQCERAASTWPALVWNRVID